MLNLYSARYTVYYRKDGAADWSSTTVYDNGTTIFGLLPSTYYNFKIVGSNQYTTGDASNVIRVDTKSSEKLIFDVVVVVVAVVVVVVVDNNRERAASNQAFRSGK